MADFSSSRRRFLMLAAGAGGLCALGAAAWQKRGPFAASAAALAADSKPLQLFSRQSWALGSDVKLSVLDADEAHARHALDAAFSELNQIEDVLSIYRPHSQLSQLNKTGRIDNPHAHLSTVLHASDELSRKTNGAFDVTVQPLWELYFDAKKRRTLPDAAAVSEARAKVNYRSISISDGRIETKSAGTKLTFNGIGQGYAADRVLAVLQAHGIEHALIDTGEFRSEGHNAEGNSYTVGIQHPRNPEAFVGVCRLDGRALATSGDYATYFSDDFLFNHIFDPATGASPRELASVSIVAPTAMLADALTKPVFVLGKEKGLALLENFPGCDAFLVAKDGAMVTTRNFPLA